MANSVPTLTGLATPVTFLENTVNGAPQIIDADVTFTDADNNFDGGALTVTGLLAEDTVAIRNQGAGAGQIGVSGSNVTFGGTVIGSFAGGAGSTLTVTFNADATAAGDRGADREPDLRQFLRHADREPQPRAQGHRRRRLRRHRAARVCRSRPAPPIRSTASMWGRSARPASPTSTATATSTPSSGTTSAPCDYFENTGSAIAPAFTEQTGAANPFNGVDVGTHSTPSFADLDGDGDLDAIVGDSCGTLRYFQNTGSAIAPAFAEQHRRRQSVQRRRCGAATARPASPTSTATATSTPSSASTTASCDYFQNTGSAIAPIFTERTGAANPFNGVDVGTTARRSFADLDGDGDLDAVVGDTTAPCAISRTPARPSRRPSSSAPAPPIRSTASMWGSTARPASPTSTATATSTPSWGHTTATCTISRTPRRISPRRISPSRPAPPIRSTASMWGASARPASPTSTATATSTPSSGTLTAP